MLNLKEKLFGKSDKTATPVNNVPKPNLPENFDSPVFGFVDVKLPSDEILKVCIVVSRIVSRKIPGGGQFCHVLFLFRILVLSSSAP